MKDWRPVKPKHSAFKKKQYQELTKLASFIYQIGETPFIRKPSKEIPLTEITSPLVKKKIAYVKKCLLEYRKITGKGRGITAIQVGIPLRFSAIFTPENEILIIINPKVIERSHRLLLYPEMCMSANPIIAPTVRPSWITFTYFDEQAREQLWNTKDEIDATRMMNRVFQHEIDHMDGVMNIDRVHAKELIFATDPAYYETAKFETVYYNKEV